MKYLLTEEAEQDLKNIHKYGMLRFGERLDDEYFLGFFNQFEQIARNPYLYLAVDYIRKGYRKSVYGVDSIYYIVNNGVVEIISIIGRQDHMEKLK